MGAKLRLELANRNAESPGNLNRAGRRHEAHRLWAEPCWTFLGHLSRQPVGPHRLLGTPKPVVQVQSGVRARTQAVTAACEAAPGSWEAGGEAAGTRRAWLGPPSLGRPSGRRPGRGAEAVEAAAANALARRGRLEGRKVGERGRAGPASSLGLTVAAAVGKFGRVGPGVAVPVTASWPSDAAKPLRARSPGSSGNRTRVSGARGAASGCRFSGLTRRVRLRQVFQFLNFPVWRMCLGGRTSAGSACSAPPRYQGPTAGPN